MTAKEVTEAISKWNDLNTSALQQAEEAYAIAEEARAKRFDPRDHVEIPRAADLASRTSRILWVMMSTATGTRLAASSDRIRLRCKTSLLSRTSLNSGDCATQAL